MSRTPVITRVAAILAASGRTEAECIIGFTHRALAACIYEKDEPTPAQLSAVRRAVARLVASGRAERSQKRWDSQSYSVMSWAEDLPPRFHQRRGKHGGTHVYSNPGGVLIFRTPTNEDLEARLAWLKARTIERNR